MKALVKKTLAALDKSKIPVNNEKHLVPCADGFAHHWEIEEPNGKYALGMCKNCSTVRKFFNAFPPAKHNQWVSGNRLLDGGTEQPTTSGHLGKAQTQADL